MIRAVGNTVAADTRYRSPVQPKSGVNLRLRERSCEARSSAKGRLEPLARKHSAAGYSLKPTLSEVPGTFLLEGPDQTGCGHPAFLVQRLKQTHSGRSRQHWFNGRYLSGAVARPSYSRIAVRPLPP